MRLFRVVGLGLLLSALVCAQMDMANAHQEKKETGKKHIVEMQDNKFVPDKLDIRVGDTVVWINKGKNSHTATADKKTDPNYFDTGVINGAQTPPAESKAFELKSAGDVPYHCEKHPKTMKGTITVK